VIEAYLGRGAAARMVASAGPEPTRGR